MMTFLKEMGEKGFLRLAKFFYFPGFGLVLYVTRQEYLSGFISFKRKSKVKSKTFDTIE